MQVELGAFQEVEGDGLCQVYIGAGVNNNSTVCAVPGLTVNTFAYSSNGNLCMGGGETKQFGPKYGPGDTIGVLLIRWWLENSQSA